MSKVSPFAALSLGLLAAPLAAQQSLMPFLPEKTIVAITVPDLDASIGEFSQMPLAKIWREEEVQNFVRDALDVAQEQIEQGMEQARAMHQQGMLPVDPDKLMQLRIKGGTFAVTKMEINVGDFGPLPSFGILLHLDFGDTAQQWHGVVNMGIDMLTQEAGDDMAREETVAAGNKVITLSPTKAPPGMDMSLNVALVENGIIIGTLADDVKAAVEAMAANKPRLAATDRYKTNSKHLLTEGAEAEVFMRVDAMIDFGINSLGMLAEMEPDMAWLNAEGIGRAVEALGLKAIQSVGATSTYKDGKAISKSYAVAPAPDRKGLLAGANKNLDLDFLQWVPKDAVSFSALTMEPMSIYDSLIAALKAYDPDFAKMALSQLDGLEEQIGFKIRDDLFGALGDTVITWSMPMATMMSPPEMAILLKVNDEAKVVKVLESLTGLSDGLVELEESERRGVKTYQFRVNFDPGMGGMNPFDMFNPSFSFKNGYMVAGFSPSDIRRVFKRMDRGADADPKKDIRGNREFAEYVGRYPTAIQSLSFTDWKANFESLYQMATSVLAFVPMNEDIPFDMSMLPDASTMTQHMFGSIYYTEADGTGMSSTTVSPFGPEMAIALAVLVGAGAGAAMAMADGGF